MRCTCLIVGVMIAVALSPSSLYAYVGPGASLSAFGALLSLVAAILVAAFGFVWYPVKRMMRALKRRRDAHGSVPVDSPTS